MKWGILLVVPFVLANCKRHSSNSAFVLTSDTISQLSATFRPNYFLLGDFNGDKIQDTLKEIYVSQNTNKKTENKFFAQNLTEIQKHLNKTKPSTRIVSSHAPKDTFVLSDENNQIGLWMLDNLGDLNNDGTDEMGYAINYVNASPLNAYVVLSYKNEWFEMIYFTFHEELNNERNSPFKNKKLIQKMDGKKIEAFVYDQAQKKTNTSIFLLQQHP